MTFSLAFSYCFIIQITVTAPTASLWGICHEIVKHDLRSISEKQTYFSHIQ